MNITTKDIGRKKMDTFKFKVICSLTALSLIAACGKSGNGSGPGGGLQAEEAAPEDGSNIKGHYQAKFVTMNPHVNGTIPGSANFVRKENDDRLYVYVRLFAGGVKAWHMQHVYTGSRCPTLNDDTNLDGFIDIQEAEAVLGKILIPLDSDVSTQSSGRRFFPLADLSGYYHYERITNFNRFLRDLQSEDKEPEDDTVKLGPGEGLRLMGKAVLIQGVAETVDLPETVATKGRHRSFQTLPIACGVFQKVESEPGDPYVTDQIPGPIADVVEGQDQPAPDDVPSTTTGNGGTTGSTGTTNDSDDGDGPVSDGEGGTTGGGSSGGTSGRTTGSGSGSGSSTGSGSTGSGTGTSTGNSTSGGTTTGSTTSGTTTSGSETGTSGGSTTSTASSSSSSSSSSTTTTTTTTGGSSLTSSTSTSTGTTTGGFLDSSSGV